MTPTNSDMEEIWAILAQEGRENLSIIESTLLKLEKKPDSRGEIATLFRALHTFKGSVRMMDFSTTEGLAHHAEDLVALVRDEGVALDAEMIDLLLVAMDRMRTLLDHILTFHTDVEPAELADLSGKLLELVERKKALKVAKTPEPEKKDPLPDSVPDETPIQTEMNQPAEDTSPDVEIDLQIDHHKSDEASEPVQEAFIFEPVNLAEDPEYVKMFLEMSLGEINQLHTALDEFRKNMLQGVTPEQFKNVREPLENLQIASERMGYQQICSLLESLGKLVQSKKKSFKKADIVQLTELEAGISREFEQLQKGTVVENEPVEDVQGLPDLYRDWYSQQVEVDLERLRAIIETIRKNSQGSLSNDTDQQRMLADDLNDVLGSLYHSCFYYGLEKAAHLTLILEDISVRIRQEEIPISQSFLNILDTYLSQMQEAFETPEADHSSISATFEVMINLSQQIINLTDRNPMLQVTRSFINSLDIAPQFKEVLTHENLAEISQSLRAGMNLYTILANLDEDAGMGHAFQKWVRSGSITPITNITSSYGQQSCLFTFLVTSCFDFDAIQEKIRELDPEGKFLKVSRCISHPDHKMDISLEGRYINNLIRGSRQETGVINNGAIPIEVLTEMTEMVGGLITDQTTLNRVIIRLTEMNTVENLMRLLRTVLGGKALGTETWENVQRELETYWAAWDMDISTLAQTEVKLDATLNQLQEMTRTLGLRPAAELLDPLAKIVQTVAFRQGKQVALECSGRDAELDQLTFRTLADTVHSLLAYCINESIESPKHRNLSGKNPTGQLLVSVSRAENHTQVIIEDDGSGLDFSKIRTRGNEIGWNDKKLSEADLTEWLFRPEYYAQTSMSINLGILRSGLEAKKGKLILINKPGSGLRFIITLQLDMAVMDGMVVRVGDIRYIIPVQAIQRILQTTAENLVQTSADGGSTLLNIDGKVYPVYRLIARSNAEPVDYGQTPGLLVVVEKEPRSIALEVDELIGRQSVLVRPLSTTLVDVKNTIGVALLGEGEVGMVLDLDAL